MCQTVPAERMCCGKNDNLTVIPLINKILFKIDASVAI